MQALLQQMVVVVLGVLLCYGGYRFIKSRQLFGEVEALKEEGKHVQAQLEKALRETYNKNTEIDELNQEIQIAKEKANSAKLLAEQELEMEAIKRRDRYEQQLQEEFKKLKETSDLTAYQQELEQLQFSISEAKGTLDALQQQQLLELDKENFISTHTIQLEPSDQDDINLIKQFTTRLSRKSALLKLIWSEFYQKPLQWLCKSLGADKTTGIYKITEVSSGRMYIGQAVDIGTRWKDHVKNGLGIGTSDFLTNKFYKTMNSAGPENFTFEILEVCDRKLLNEREAYWIDFFNATSYGFNSKAGTVKEG